MEGNGQSRRYSQITLNSSQGSRYGSLQSTSHNDLVSEVSEDRYRQGQLGLSASARSFSGGAGGDSSYYPDPTSTFSGGTSLSAAQLSYVPDYDSGGGTRQQTAEFGSYGANIMMYSVPQTNTQTSLYNTSAYAPPLSSRHNNITSGPLPPSQQDVSQQYFGADVPGAATTLEHASSAAVAPASAYYQSISPSFHYNGGGGGGTGTGTGGGASGLTGVESFSQLADLGANNSSVMSEPADRNGSHAAEFEEKWLDYQSRLAGVFQEITDGNLERAADGLLSVSFWLLSRVDGLGTSHLGGLRPYGGSLLTYTRSPHTGLTEDDESLHSDRLKLWQDFNNAWLALMFKQKRYMLREVQEADVRQPLSLRAVKRMGDELIRLCDGIEKYGLVDYQLGVWEDEIERREYHAFLPRRGVCGF